MWDKFEEKCELNSESHYLHMGISYLFNIIIVTFILTNNVVK